MAWEYPKISKLVSGEIIDNFNNIKNDIVLISYLTYICDLTYQVVKTTNDKNQTEYLQATAPLYTDANASKHYNNSAGEQFSCVEGIMNIYEQKKIGSKIWLRVSNTPRGEDKVYL